MRLLPFLAAACIAAASPGVGAPLPAHAESLAGHQAIYAVRLGRASSSSQIIGVEGASMLRFERACDGWIASERLTMVMETLSGTQIPRDVRFTGWEAFDGRSYKFAARSESPAGQEAFRGTAKLGPELAGKATFTDPEERAVELPKGTRFYAGFTRWVLDQVASGEKIGETVTFDGADGDGPQKVTLFLTKAKKVPENMPDLGKLGDAEAFNARMAFYKIDSSAAEPEYEIEARLLANGIATHLTIEFSDFTIVEEIQQLEAVPPADC